MFSDFLMDIVFRRRKLEKTFNTEKVLKKEYGDRMARTIAMRMAVLKNAANLSLVPTTKPERRHQLKADRDELYAVDLVHPFRLIFEPNHDPVPRKDDGGVDTGRVTAITIVDVIDYH
jgi:proteic killer suppression protein